MTDRKPSKDFETRLDQARRWRDAERPYIEEIFSFCCPGRENDFTKRRNDFPVADDAETFVDIPEELATDLASDLITYFTPSEARWMELEVTTEINEDYSDEVLAIIEQRENTIFELIQTSNYNDIAPQWGFEAATHGTPALWVEASHISSPIFCESVPPHELLIVPGHLGILDRFREKRVLAQSLPALFKDWKEIDLSSDRLQQKISKPGQTCCVIWGFWLDWSDPGNPLWRCEITVDKIRVTPDDPLKMGPYGGSIPLLVGRFNPQTGRPWGRGAGRKALPTMRSYDQVEETVLSGLDQNLRNTIIYPADGYLDLSEGIEPGKAYAAHRSFTKDQIFALNNQVNFDQGWFTQDKFEQRLRTAFYQDGPRQTGDTPPSASQWLDQRRAVQKRIGKPSAPLWTELVLPFVQRIETLGVQIGRLQDSITVHGTAITVMPISPLQKAQNQDEINQAQQNLSLAFQTMQDQVGTVVDLTKTFKNIVRISGDNITVIKDTPDAPPQVPGTGPTA